MVGIEYYWIFIVDTTVYYLVLMVGAFGYLWWVLLCAVQGIVMDTIESWNANKTNRESCYLVLKENNI